MADFLASPDYRALFRLLPDNYLLLAPDGTVLDNTDSHVAVSLRTREQALGQNIFAAYPSAPESQRDLDASLEHVRRHLAPHTMPLLRYDLERPAALGGGTEQRYWQITHFPLLDERGELQYILQRPQDVTEATLAMQRAEVVQREFDEATERNHFVLQSMPVMVWTTRPDGWAEYFNPRWTEFTGRTLAETLGEGWVADLHPDDVAPTTARWEAARQHGTTYQVEYRMRRHDGRYRWHLARGVPRLGPDGQVQMWVGCNADIHEQKLMVEELLKANEEQAELSDQAYRQSQLTRQQRQTFDTLLTNAPAMITIVRGPEHRYEFANTLFRGLVGGQDLVGRTVAEVFPEVVGQGIMAILDGVYRTGEPFVGTEVLVQLAAADGSGTLRDAYFNFTYQRFEEHGEPAGITAYAYEATELVQTRQALQQLGGSGAIAAPAK
ncbi:hypothetical protein BEN47_07510 [Hymenobacter lapidarius]|uniref:histidine kinase n=1 Tax=Hymenobacter lapidarius TaxID=1908237 RepID=A0A1G1TEE7_9BACT|nr:PAS domain-containing protein [Hymenobacter lapidarius]OGX89238.1 hypothetical protein BEN47_07510 [Hymenobacter lapidarius]